MQPSDALVIFGITGDLAHKKIFPALYALARSGHLAVPVIGVARSDMTTTQLVDRARASVKDREREHFDEEVFQKLARLMQYVSGDYSDPDAFRRLGGALGSAQRPLFYLAIPPSAFP